MRFTMAPDPKRISTSDDIPAPPDPMRPGGPELKVRRDETLVRRASDHGRSGRAVRIGRLDQNLRVRRTGIAAGEALAKVKLVRRVRLTGIVCFLGSSGAASIITYGSLFHTPVKAFLVLDWFVARDRLGSCRCSCVLDWSAPGWVCRSARVMRLLENVSCSAIF